MGAGIPFPSMAHLQPSPERFIFADGEAQTFYVLIVFSVLTEFWDWTQFEVCNLLCVIMEREVGHNE